MTTERFNDVVKEFLTKTESTLIRKQGEYNLGDDRMSFFKRMAEIEGVLPTQALLHCMSKHITSFVDMVQSGEKFSQELWDEKLGDLVNYAILLRGLLEDLNMYKEEK